MRKFINVLSVFLIACWTINAVWLWFSEQLVLDYHIVATVILTIFILVFFFLRKQKYILGVLFMLLLYFLGVLKPSWFYEENSFFLSVGNSTMSVGYVNLLAFAIMIIVVVSNRVLIKYWVKKYIFN